MLLHHTGGPELGTGDAVDNPQWHRILLLWRADGARPEGKHYRATAHPGTQLQALNASTGIQVLCFRIIARAIEAALLHSPASVVPPG